MANLMDLERRLSDLERRPNRGGAGQQVDAKSGIPRTERQYGRRRPFEQYLLVGVRETLPTAQAEHKDQLTVLRGGSGVADKFYACRETATDGTYEWVELTAVASHTHTESEITDFAHAHSSFQNFEVNASRNIVTSGGVNVTSTTGATILSDTFTLSNGVTYDIYVPLGHAQLNAPAGQWIEAAIEITGTGVTWSRIWLGTGTVGGERSVGPYAVVRAVAGAGQVVTVALHARVTGGTGSVGTASMLGQAIARGGGGVA